MFWFADSPKAEVVTVLRYSCTGSSPQLVVFIEKAVPCIIDKFDGFGGMGRCESSGDKVACS